MTEAHRRRLSEFRLTFHEDKARLIEFDRLPSLRSCETLPPAIYALPWSDPRWSNGGEASESDQMAG
jgi:hypothetical protein